MNPDLAYDPLELEADPYPLYRRLRDETPVYAGRTHGGEFWALSRFADVQAGARDWATFSSVEGNDLDDTGLLFAPAGELSSADPPIHTRLRDAVKKEFGASAVRMNLEHTVRSAARELIGRLVGAHSVDFARDLAYPLPAAVMAGWLGFPEADHSQLARWHAEMLERIPGRVGLTEGGLRASREMRDYVSAAAVARRAHERDDLLGVLVRAEAAGDLSEVEVLGSVLLLFVAGISTTSALIASALLHLHLFADQRRLLRRSPELIPKAVEEFLRFDAPFQWFTRVATRDVRVHGTVIPAGGRVVLAWASANRDERRWPDADELVITRASERHLAFGEGIHHCLGAPLARMEARIALEELMPRLIDYELEGAVERRFTPSERTIVRLPAAVDWAAPSRS
jgi:cytochrome P450